MRSLYKTPKVSIIVPPGLYALGDPCYTIEDREEWVALLDSCNGFENPVGRSRNKNVYAFSTYRGDGTYRGSDGFEYDVDSGLIGLAPVELGSDGIRIGLCKSVLVSKEIQCSSDDGLLTFGNIVINTRR